jgi:opacity protein-like surface antigen
MKRVFAVLCLSLAATPALAEGIDINLSSHALRGAFTGSISQMFPRLDGLYEAGVLVGEVEEREYYQGHAGLLVSGDAGAERANVVAGLGGRIAVLDVDDVDVTGGALALGGMIEARLPAYNRIGAVVYAYGAPEASSFGDFEGYIEYAAGLDYQVLRNASLYAGYRQLKVDSKDAGNVTVDNGWHLGLRLSF